MAEAERAKQEYTTNHGGLFLCSRRVNFRSKIVNMNRKKALFEKWKRVRLGMKKKSSIQTENFYGRFCAVSE